MNKKMAESFLYLIIGVAIIYAVEIEILKLPELFVILLDFAAFAAILHGAFELYNIIAFGEPS